MRVLVLGGDGMLGGELVRRLVRDHDVTATVRATAPSCPPPPTGCSPAWTSAAATPWSTRSPRCDRTPS
ncbi:hypothetical protein MXD62_13545 [Frankia sp. Mgl5]|nr:hypothetical protein [Frankia sp. Mgl5]